MPPVQGFQGAGPPPWYAGIGSGNQRLELAKRMLARLQSQNAIRAQRGFAAKPVGTLEEITAGIPAGYKPPQPGMSPAMRLLNASLGRQLYPGQGGQYWSWAPQAAPQGPPPVYPPGSVLNPSTGQYELPPSAFFGA